MTLQVFDTGGTDRTISEVRVFDSGGVDRVVTEIRVFDAGGTDRVVYSAGGGGIAVFCTPFSVSGHSPSGPATSNLTTAAASGGTAPYTYLWTIEEQGAVATPTINSPTADATTFTQGGLSAAGGYITDIFRVTATDSLGATGYNLVTGYFFRG